MQFFIAVQKPLFHSSAFHIAQRRKFLGLWIDFLIEWSLGSHEE
jgi:hypothetical protein